MFAQVRLDGLCVLQYKERSFSHKEKLEKSVNCERASSCLEPTLTST